MGDRCSVTLSIYGKVTTAKQAADLREQARFMAKDLPPFELVP